MTPELGGIVELANPCTNRAQMGNQTLIANGIDVAIYCNPQNKQNSTKKLQLVMEFVALQPLLRQREVAILKIWPSEKRVFISILKK